MRSTLAARVGATVGALLLLASLAAGAAEPSVSTALLLTAGPGKTTTSDDIQYVTCSLGGGAFVSPDASGPPSPLAAVGARFFGKQPDDDEGADGRAAPAANATTTAPIRDFGTVGCSTVWLAGGRSVRVHGDAASDCKAVWSAAKDGGAVLTARKRAGPILWQLTLPSDGRAPARLACAGDCPLTAAAPPCTPSTLAGLGLPRGRGGDGLVAATSSSFAQILAGAESTCAAGSPAPEGDAPWPAPPGAPLSYGLAGRFFPQVYGPDECASPTPWRWWGVPPDMEAGPGTDERCVPAVDFRAAGVPWAGAGEPPLGPVFASCFGAALAGWVRLPNATDSIVFHGDIPDRAAYGDKFRVCARFSGQVELVLAGSPIALASPDPRVDLTFTCQDATFAGAAGSLVPISVRYAAPPISELHVLQLWVIPVAAVYDLAPDQGGPTPVFQCDACTPFSPVSDQCCPPLGSCAYRSVCPGGGSGGPGPSPTPTGEPTTPTPTTPVPTTPAPTTPADTTGPPDTSQPPTTTPGSYGTSPPPTTPPETTVPAETTGTPPPTPTQSVPPATTTPPPPPPTTTPGGGYYGTPSPPPTTPPGGYGGYGTPPPPPPETTAPPPPTTTPPASCPPDGGDELEAAARLNWAQFQQATAAAANVDELELLLELF